MSLLEKYAVPGPRYTSYPTVPYWEDSVPESREWIHAVQSTIAKESVPSVSLYIHLPYCEKLCTFCGCNTRITVRHEVERPYIEALLREWSSYLKILPAETEIAEIHLGGGTPTFFSPNHLRYLLEELLASFPAARSAELSFEANPNTTTSEHMQVLYDIGFRRLSFGVQDFDPQVQTLIHRIQPLATVERVVREARAIGYTSINFDLIYGLPAQTTDTILDTIAKTAQLRPDRLAFYSYAHIPWLKPAQRMYEDQLPSEDEKFQFYQVGKLALEDAGYLDIGMDHFSLPSDTLYQAAKNGRLHRNFMGYNTTPTAVLIGLGASAISDAWTAFVQNIKSVEDYIKATRDMPFPYYRGHRLTAQDEYIRGHILNLMCRFTTSWEEEEYPEYWSQVHSRLSSVIEDGLVEWTGQNISVSEEGRAFIRNICMALDARMWARRPETQLFSSTV